LLRPYGNAASQHRNIAATRHRITAAMHHRGNASSRQCIIAATHHRGNADIVRANLVFAPSAPQRATAT
jgi:hypothetical protein